MSEKGRIWEVVQQKAESLTAKQKRWLVIGVLIVGTVFFSWSIFQGLKGKSVEVVIEHIAFPDHK